MRGPSFLNANRLATGQGAILLDERELKAEMKAYGHESLPLSQKIPLIVLFPGSSGASIFTSPVPASGKQVEEAAK